MDHRAPLKFHTVLAFEGMPCYVEEVVGQGSNAIVYKGWYQDRLHQDLRHKVLVKELFPFHPQQKIRRGEDGHIVVDPEAAEVWDTHRKSFEIGNQVHLRLLYDHPDMMAMGSNLNSFRYNGTLYSVLGYTGGRSLDAELNKRAGSIRFTAQRMIGLLDALEAFHKSGYLHLDISPDNIMLVGQEEQERIFLIDYNSVKEVGFRDSSYLSCKPGFSAPEVSTGNRDRIGFASDLYSVAAVFYRCIMGRSLTLAERLQPKPPDGRDSPMLTGMPQTVSAMVGSILKKGLNTLPQRRYQAIGQMRMAFQELIDRIDCVGVTHWSLWENGKRSTEELVRMNPSLGYLRGENGLYPIRLDSMSLEGYLNDMLSPAGSSGMILAQGGMGKTTLLLHTALLQGKRYTPTTPAIFYISLNGWDKMDTQYIRRQILLRLRFKKGENSFDSAMHSLHQLLKQPIHTKQGDIPVILLLLDGLNEVQGNTAPLIQEINDLSSMAGVRILAASRSEVPELKLKSARLMPLNPEDIGQALGRNGLLIPENQEVLRLLQTPLILSIYIQASGGGKQLNIQSEQELMKAYLDALLEKETRQLPEDSPQRWMTEAALGYVLPAIAIEAKRRNGTLTGEQLLHVMTRCWKTVGSRRFRKTYHDWIGHSADIRSGAQTAEEWLGIVVDGLLWKRMGMLTRDDSGSYRIFHQMVAEYLAGYKIPMVRRGWRMIGVTAILLCALLAVGIQRNNQQKKAEAEIKGVLELGAGEYAKYGNVYNLVYDLLDKAISGDDTSLQLYYDRSLARLRQEQERTDSEQIDAEQMAQSSVHDGLRLTWAETPTIYQYSRLSQLMYYPDERAEYYGQQLPLLKSWTESEALQEKVPDFAQAFLALLEADANLAAELYHTAVGMHLPEGAQQETWVEQIHSTVALLGPLEAHRVTSTEEDRGQRLGTLNNIYLGKKTEFEEQRSKLEQYIENLS